MRFIHPKYFFFPQIFAKIQVWVIRKCGLYTPVYGKRTITNLDAYTDMDVHAYADAAVTIALLGPVVQSIISLTSSLRGQYVTVSRLYNQTH